MTKRWSGTVSDLTRTKRQASKDRRQEDKWISRAEQQRAEIDAAEVAPPQPEAKRT